MKRIHCCVGLCVLTLLASNVTVAAGKNLALGKKYTMSSVPRYKHCTDPDDKVQLTDGKLTKGHFWTQKGTVGWQRTPYVAITVNLERVEPIAGVSLGTAAGVAGVSWPLCIQIMVSDDGKTYRDVGDLVELDRKVNGPWPDGYAIRRLITSELKTKGRYVRFLVVPSRSFVFVDEIKVFRGPDELLSKAPGGQLVKDSMAKIAKRSRISAAVSQCFSADTGNIKGAINRAGLKNEPVKKGLIDRVEKARKALVGVKLTMSKSFRAIVPFCPEHAQLFQVQAALWKALGRPDVVGWTAPHWDLLDPYAVPPKSSGGQIDVHTMLGEYRSAALNLANSTDKPKKVQIRFDGLNGAPCPKYITVHSVPWTDTNHGKLTASALPVVQQEGDRWNITLQSGLVGQVWFTFHVTDLTPGKSTGAVVVESDGSEIVRVPMQLNVYPMTFPKKTTLGLGGWSYTNRTPMYEVTKQNKGAFLKHMKDHFVNAPWSTSSAIKKVEFDKDGTAKLDTKELDAWIDQWPDAKMYLSFLGIGGYHGVHTKSFKGAKCGTDEFKQKVGAWATALVEHLRTRGITPDRFGILISDEPREGIETEPIVAFANAIHAAQPDLVVWVDPHYNHPSKAPADLFNTSDILCPNRPKWLENKERFSKFYLDQQKKGRTLQLYSCSGPARLLDPYSYYRLQAWQCWQIGATASYFWAFGDGSSWNEYLDSGIIYSPIFIDETTVTAAKQMEAIRESVEDYETFVMLRNAIARAKAAGRNDAQVTQAETLLKSGVDGVLNAEGVDQIMWNKPKDREKADSVRVQILKALSGLK